MESRIDVRRKDFKKSFDDPLRRRELQQVQIRKQQRDANLAKKRNQTITAGDENTVLPPGDSLREVPEEICRQLMDFDPKFHHSAAQAVRRLLSLETHPPIQTVINAGLVPRFVDFLHMDDNPDLQFEAAWALTNIASGSSSQTYAVVNAGAIPEFVRLMDSPRLDVREQAIWALGNIAGDCPDLRDKVIKAGGFPPLIRELKRADSGDIRVSLLRYATWTLSNFCRGKTEEPMELIREALPVLRVLLYANDVEILTDACWAISYMSDTNEGTNANVINEIIRSGVCGRLVELLGHKSFLVKTPALRAVGNIVTGDDHQTQVMIGYGCIPKLKALLQNARKPIRKEACWALSNITAGSREQIDEVIQNGIMPEIAKLLMNDEFEVKREATWCLANAASGGNASQVAAIVDAGALPPLVNVLGVNDTRVVGIALEAIENILKTGKWRQQEENLPENPYVSKLEEAGAFPYLEKLQCMSVKRLHSQVIRIMTNYLDVYVANEQAVPASRFGGMAG